MQYKIDQEKKEFIFTNEFPMLSAGEPYFVVVNKGELSLSAEGVEIISEPKQGTQVFDAAMDRPVGWFKGTFRQFNAPEAVLMNAYGMRKGGIWTGYRNLDGHMGISSLRTVGSDARLYDLQGRRIEGQPAKGLYISNGKKVVVK